MDTPEITGIDDAAVEVAVEVLLARIDRGTFVGKRDIPEITGIDDAAVEAAVEAILRAHRSRFLASTVASTMVLSFIVAVGLGIAALVSDMNWKPACVSGAICFASYWIGRGMYLSGRWR